MKEPLPNILVPSSDFVWIAAAGVAGIAAGYLLGTNVQFVPETRGTLPTASSAESAESEAVSSMASSAPLELTDQISRLAVTLSSGSASELLAELKRVLADRSLPRTFAAQARQSLILKLIGLGCGEQVLAISAWPGTSREEALQTVVEALAGQDPHAAEALVMASAAGRDRQLATRAFLKVLGERDRERGMEFLRKNPPAREVAHDFFWSWTQSNPRQAAEAALALQKEIGPGLIHAPIHDWAKSNPEEAWKWIQAQNQEVRESALHAYGNGLANGDPQKALEILMAMPELGANYGDWVGRRLATNVAEAETILNRVPPGELRTNLIEGMTQSLSRSDPLGAIAWSKTLLPGEGAAALRGLFDILGQSDPPSAIQLALENLDTKDADLAIRAAANIWAYRDPEGAFLGLVQQLDENRLAAVLPSIFNQGNSVVGQDLARWIELLQPLQPDLRKELFRTMASSWGQYDTQGAIRRIGTLAPSDQADFAKAMLGGVSSSNPDLAKDLALLLKPEDAVAQARQIASAIAYRNPAEAAQFVRDLHPQVDSPARTEGIKAAVRDWAFDDPWGAEAFVASLPNGDAKNQSARVLGQQLSQFDLEAATRVLGHLGPSPEREEMIRELARRWQGVDARRGRAALSPFLQSTSDQKLLQEVFQQ